ncbi:ABC transporter substrate-binding protein [Ralstonia solanacearum]|uniref:Amino acid transporter n=1 Tax=Ralstonia solanacearum K60 TaxID=1091042 RepID=A0AAP8D5B6_RALSL|nr:ABC transporter substrate-binding protein [Ralstonia solanacearum]MBT1538442.1 ABC transporter substrate-binding protein [Ralstonia solanacearum]OYQ14661.1 amino acid transporter [Ralstonia solanacearum K60]QOK82035.1 ABC transporter substrate-binding protein [Ralstonia solanacearum]RIJ85601.1 amino acid transporter [Ralstonia solanacearum]CCF95675.1 putative ABC-type branched-chain amino acid transporter [Ralstonia solanacearum K60]
MTGHPSVLRNRIACALSMSLALISGQVLAEPGITDNKILIGQTAGFTGPAGEQVKEMTQGARLYLDAVNRSGGVYGRKIELVSEDDGFDADASKRHAHALLVDKQVFALFLSRGTPNTEAIVTEAHAVGAPVVAPSTGASIFFDRPDPLVFVVRAKYQTEIAELVHHFETLGLKRLALVNVNDSFGKDTEAGFNAATQQLPRSTHQIFTVDRLRPNLDKATADIVKFAPSAVILACAGTTAQALAEALTKQGTISQLATLSNNSSTAFARSLGNLARGVMVTQVMPSPVRATSPIGRELAASAKSAGMVPSYGMMEGYASAKLLVEGLKRAGKTPTRAGFVAGLEAAGTIDLGGLDIRNGRNNHKGSSFVEITVIGPHGTFIK